ncbi:MAG: lipoate--protein ligase family protein [Elainellaceae cyanobacterium]
MGVALLASRCPWRLIPPVVASGQTQMQIDAWLLRQQEQGHLPPTLRFYRWSRPTVSLGYLQEVPNQWVTLSQSQPLDLVRRPTGGRAVLHSGDLTYAVAVRYQRGSRTEIYRHLCEFLIRGWRSLGLDLHYGGERGSYRRRANCFGVATQADLVDPQGHKFIGSAQRYGRDRHGAGRDRVVLQHGSMQLAPDPQLFEALFAEPAPKAQFLPHQVDDAFIGKAVETLTTVAQAWFNVDFVAQPLSVQELADIQSYSAIAAPDLRQSQIR